MQGTKLQTKGDEWCEIKIKLEEGRLSICGNYGEIISKVSARKQALDYWASYFEDNPAEMELMRRKFDKQFRTVKGAARFVVETDGEFHGLDVHKENGKNVYLTQSCGQITEELSRFFPEVVPYLKWHLNDMKAGCEHQEGLGWKPCPGYHKENETCSPVVLPEVTDAWGHRRPFQSEWSKKDPKKCKYDAIGAPCPTCDYKYGTEWKKRELTEAVISWIYAFMGWTMTP